MGLYPEWVWAKSSKTRLERLKMDISLKAKLLAGGVNVDGLEAGMIEAFEKAIGGLAHAARSEWIRIAQQRLKSSRADYVNGLQQAESFSMKKLGSASQFEITLVGEFPNNLEHGLPAFDMKSVRPGWLGGGKAIRAKEGHSYVRIPFRHSTSSSSRLAYSGKAAKVGLQKELKRTVKEFGLDRMVRSSSGDVVGGTVARLKNKTAGVHPYLQGLTRVQTPTGGKTKDGKGRGSGKLLTFRVMSEKSPASAWIHPGFKAQNILPEVERWVDRELDKIMGYILGE